MKGPESQRNESHESLQIRMEYTYKGPFNNILSTNEADTFVLAQAPDGASEFDGYIETSIGTFAFQGKLTEAHIFVQKVKVYCEEGSNIKKRLNEIAEEIKVKEVEKFNAGPTRKDDFDTYSKIGGEIQELRTEQRQLEIRLSSLEASVKSYVI